MNDDVIGRDDVVWLTPLTPIVCERCQVPLQLVYGLGWSFKHHHAVLQHAQCPKCFISTPLVLVDLEVTQPDFPEKKKKTYVKSVSGSAGGRRQKRTRQEVREASCQEDGGETAPEFRRGQNEV